MEWFLNIVLLHTFLLMFAREAVSGPIMCDKTTPPAKELAYNAAFEFFFPEERKSRQPCSWLITAYRNGHILRLRFDNVNLTKSSNGSCPNQVLVYDGPNAKSPVLTSLCGMGDVDIETSSRQALVAVSLDESRALFSSVKFHLRYNSLMPREDEHHVMWILAFVGIVGVLCCIAFCCGILKCLVQWRTARMSAQARSSAGTATDPSDRDGDDDGDGMERAPQKMSISDRLWDFLQRMFQEKHWWNPNPASRPNSTNRNGRNNRQHSHRHHHPHQQQLRNPPDQQHPTQHQQSHNQRRRHHHQPRSDANVGASPLEFDSNLSDCPRPPRNEFSFQDIPVSSFTSDPSEVKPPAYEDCVKTTNPVYLYHYGEDRLAAYSRNVDSKNGQDGPPSTPPTDSLAPPPPYMEIGADVSASSHTGQESCESSAAFQSNGENVLPRNCSDGDNTMYSDNAPPYLRYSDQDDGGNGNTSSMGPPPPFYEVADVPTLPSGPRHSPDNTMTTRAIPTEGASLQKLDGNILPDLSQTSQTAMNKSVEKTETLAECSNSSSTLYKEDKSMQCGDNSVEGEIYSCGDTLEDRSTSSPHIDVTLQHDATGCSRVLPVNTTVKTAAAATAVENALIPYALMRRSGLVTSLCDGQTVKQCVSPVEECDDHEGIASTIIANSSDQGTLPDVALDGQGEVGGGRGNDK